MITQLFKLCIVAESCQYNTEFARHHVFDLGLFFLINHTYSYRSCMQTSQQWHTCTNQAIYLGSNSDETHIDVWLDNLQN